LTPIAVSTISVQSDKLPRVIRRGSFFRSVKHLIEAIEAYIVEHNNEPKPFRWIATANSIFEKITASLD
jgi:hypothetical protein